MIELIVVIVIIGVLATMAAPHFTNADARNRATADQLRTHLRYAQRVAATRNRDVCVTVTGTAVLFRIASAAGTSVACPATNSITPYNDSSGTLDMLLPAAGSTRFAPAGNFRFTPAGTLRNNAGAAFSTRTITLTEGAIVFVTLSIEPDNGYVQSSRS